MDGDAEFILVMALAVAGGVLLAGILGGMVSSGDGSTA